MDITLQTNAVLGFLFSVLAVSLLPYWASADVGNPSGKVNLFQLEQAARREHMLVRPTPQERQAVSILLDMKPRPKTFNDADLKHLKDLLDKASWLGGEQRIMHEMWTEATGKPWEESNADGQKQTRGGQ